MHGERRLTYRQAQTAANRLADAFGRAGLAPGDRIAVLARNCLEYPLLYFAASQGGGGAGAAQLPRGAGRVGATSSKTPGPGC